MIRRTAAAASAALAGLVTVCACTSTDATTDAADSTNTPTSESTKTNGSAAPEYLLEGPKTPLAAGTYQMSFYAEPGVETPDALVEVPSGYENELGWYVVSNDGGEFLGLWTVGRVYNNPCRLGKSTYHYPGPSVQNLADALVAQRSTRAAAPEPVTLDGYDGLYVEILSPPDLSKCVKVADLWGDPGGRGIYNDGQVDMVWILDVNGQRLVVDAAYSAKSTRPSDRDDLNSMVESLEFVGAGE
jgi:hypothetical protein